MPNTNECQASLSSVDGCRPYRTIQDYTGLEAILRSLTLSIFVIVGTPR